VLKSIVEYHPIDGKTSQDPGAELIAISTNGHDRLGTTLRDQEWLIA